VTHKGWKDELKEQLKKHAGDALNAANVATATNLGKPGKHTSVRSRQRVVQRNGETIHVEERVERSEG
jgi:hypothetical protein